MEKLYPVIAIMLINIVVILGDIFVKKSSHFKKFDGWHLLIIGAMIYAISAIGWFYVYRKIKLSSAGAINALFVVLYTLLVGVFYFKERLNFAELTGVALAFISIFLLYRFA